MTPAHGILQQRPGSRPIDWTDVPMQLRNRVSAVVRSPAEAEELIAFYGSPDWVPASPPIVVIPGQMPVLLGTGGKLTARQLRDMAADLWQQILAEIRSDPDDGLIDFASFGALPPREQFKKLKNNRLARILDQVAGA